MTTAALAVRARTANVQRRSRSGTLADQTGPRWRVHDQRGDMMNGWIIRLLVIALVFGLVVYEIMALAVPSLTMDTAAKPVIDAAVSTYKSTQNLDAATQAAEHRAIGKKLQVVEVAVEGDRVAVTVMREANTLVLHRIPGLEGLRYRHYTRSRPWRP